MKRFIKGLCVLIAAVLFGWNLGFSQSGPHHHAGDQATPLMPESSSKTRTVLTLPASAQEGLKQTMREHLEAIDGIVAALAQEEYARAAMLAHEELGFPKHHMAMQREEGAVFPSAYQDLAMAHHSAAEELGEVIPTKDLKQILPKLQQTIHACVKCHQTFRVQN